MTRTTTRRTMTKRTLGDLTGRPGLTRKAERLEVAIRAAIEHDHLGWLCGVLVDRGEAVTGSRVPLATLALVEERLGIEWQDQTVSF